MAIYLTGDTHREFHRIKQFCEEYETTTEDILIILGDAGINYYCNYKDNDLKNELSQLPITISALVPRSINSETSLLSLKPSVYSPETTSPPIKADIPGIKMVLIPHIAVSACSKCSALKGYTPRDSTS